MSERKPCPICGKPAEPLYRPFCSRRCADVDLGRWFTEGYRIPTVEAQDDSPAEPHRDPSA